MYTLGIDAFSSRSDRSGVEWYTYHLLRAMKRQSPADWRIFLYGLDRNDFTNDVAGDNWHWKQLRWPPRRGWRQIRLSWEMIGHSPNVLFVPAAMIPFIHPHRSWSKKFTVTTIHDVVFLKQPELYASVDRQRQEVALSFAARHASVIFVPTEAVKQELKNIVSDRIKIMVTPEGVDHETYQPTIDATKVQGIKEKYQLSEPYLLCVGRVGTKKNLATLIRAFSTWEGSKKYQLVVAGSPDFGAEEIDRIISERQMNERVRLLGFVPEADLPSLYCGAQIFVFPSAAEGFGLPVLQALATGIPTIASDIPALREVAGESAVFVDPKAEERWAAALTRVTGDEALRNSLREKGLSRASEFSWDKTAELTWQAIQDLIQSEEANS